MKKSIFLKIKKSFLTKSEKQNKKKKKKKRKKNRL